MYKHIIQESMHFCSGRSPILISMPHVGKKIPKEIASKFTHEAMQLPDVDWHLETLYDMAKAYDISVISAEYARYVIDLNRPCENTSLYPGLDTTGLCPIDTFSKQPLYLEGKAPDEKEVHHRIERYWRPYHEKLSLELKRIHDLHGVAILWDAHSIASRVPRFFSGQLPDLNFGTADLTSCDASLQEALATTMRNSPHAKNYSHVFNGRFKGGYITRHYGIPMMNIHALQLELSQFIYMQENHPYQYNSSLALKLKPLLRELLETCLRWANDHRNL